MSEYREALRNLLQAIEDETTPPAYYDNGICVFCDVSEDLCAYHAAKALLARPVPSPSELVELLRARGPDALLGAAAELIERLARPVPEHPAIDLLKCMCHAHSSDYPGSPGECHDCHAMGQFGQDRCAYHDAADYLRKLADGEYVEPAAAEKAREQELADTPTPKAQRGTWCLFAPDGRFWEGESPLKCAAAEQRERVPADVAAARIIRAIESLPSPPAATCEDCGGTGGVEMSFDPYLALPCPSCNRDESPPAATGETK